MFKLTAGKACSNAGCAMRKLGRLAEAKECLDKAWNLTSLYVLCSDCYYTDSNRIYVDIFGKLQVGIPAIGFNWQLEYDVGRFDLIVLTVPSFTRPPVWKESELKRRLLP